MTIHKTVVPVQTLPQIDSHIRIILDFANRKSEQSETSSVSVHTLYIIPFNRMRTNPYLTMFKSNTKTSKTPFDTTPSNSKAKNVILNEMLTFVQSKLTSMDAEALVMVCSSIFSWDDIEEAEKILRKLSTVKSVKCKEDFDIYDIIEIVKSFDQENGPIFVARDLHKLPKAVATSQLLKENYNLQKENQKLKANIDSMDKFLSEVVKITRRQTIYIARLEYIADDKDEVSIRGGDIIAVLEEEVDGWMRGKVLRTGKVGMFPGNYVVEYSKVENNCYEYVK